MSAKKTIKPGYPVSIMKLLLVLCVLGFCICSFFAFVDVRTEEQKQADYREELISQPLFEEAKIFADKILKEPSVLLSRAKVTRISCMKISISKTIKKVVLIETIKSDFSVCYYTAYGGQYVKVGTDMYDQMYNYKRSELILEGQDLDILFEEAEKA